MEVVTPTPSPSHRHHRGFLLVDAFVLLICIAGFYLVSQKVGIGTVTSSTNGKVVVDEPIPTAKDAGLHPGDTLLAIDGTPVFDPSNLEVLLDSKDLGQHLSITIVSHNSQRSISLIADHFYSTTYLTVIAIIGMIYFSLGLLVRLKRPDDNAALVFNLTMDCVAIMILATLGSYAVEPVGISHVVRTVYFIAYAFMPVLYIHFTFLFPYQKWPHRSRLIVSLYIVSGVIGSATAATFVLGTIPNFSRDWIEVYTHTLFALQCLYISGSLFSLTSFLHSYRITNDEIERKKLRWVILGSAIGSLAFIGLWLLPQIFLDHHPISEEFVVAITVITPITFAIGIVRYRLMDIDLIISRSTVYAIVLATLATAYAAIVPAVQHIVQEFGGTQSTTLPIVVAMLVALIFEPIRSRVQHFVEQRFFRTHYNAHHAQRILSDGIGSCHDARTLGNLVIGEIDQILCPEKIALVTVNRPKGSVNTLAYRNFPRSAWKQTAIMLATQGNHDLRPMASTEHIESGADYLAAPAEILADFRIALAHATMLSAQNTLLLVLGPKKSGLRFTLEDIDLIGSTMSMTSNAVERIMLQRDLIIKEAEAEHLAELSRLKSYFVSGVSHELKTPLTSIRMFADLLQRNRHIAPEKIHEYAYIIGSESDRLTRLINNVLDFAKIETNTRSYHKVAVDLNHCVEDVLFSMSYQITSASITITSDRCSEELTIRADPDAVMQALINLISNAVKYSIQQKNIIVRTYRRATTACVSVSDSGIGMTPEVLARVYEPFYRDRDKSTASIAGTGLGLALVRHIMDGHDGAIDAESTPGEGSQFILSFPLHQSYEKNSTD